MKQTATAFLTLLFTGIVTAAEPQIKKSPDGIHTASTAFDEAGQSETIRIFAPPSKTPIYTTGAIGVIDMRWSANSKHLLVFDHLAGGSYLKIITMKNGAWTPFECDPPSADLKEGTRYGVISVEDHQDSFTVKYLLHPRGSGEFQILQYDLSLPSDKMTNHKLTKIPAGENIPKTIGR